MDQAWPFKPVEVLNQSIQEMDTVLLLFVLHLDACFVFTTGAEWSTLIVTHFILPKGHLYLNPLILPLALHASRDRLAFFTAEYVLEPN